MILEQLKSIEDLKAMNAQQLEELARECRYVGNMLKSSGNTNLELIELAIAAHYVFELSDTFILDAAYTPSRTIMTGRISSLLDPYLSITPVATEYVNSAENILTLGHSTSAVNIAAGLAKARDLQGKKENIIVCADLNTLSGSSIFDDLNALSKLNTQLIIVLNDSAKGKPAGDTAFSQYLYDLKHNASETEHNIFRNLGLDYQYVDNGNDIMQVVDALAKAKASTQPIIVHLNTAGEAVEKADSGYHPTPYSDLTYELIEKKLKTDDKLFVLTSGTPEVMNITPERAGKLGRHYLDLGKSEEVAIELSAGLAMGGAHPVWGVYSTFLQRVYDHLIQEVAINRSPVTILVFGGGADGMNNIAHEGFFDISMSVNIPNITILAPTCREAYEAMFNWAVTYKEGPVVIRVPNDEVHNANYPVDVTTARFGNYQITHEGSEVAIFGVGTYYKLAEQVAELLIREDVDATIVNPRNLNLYDVGTLEDLRKNHRLVVTLEDGIMAGGFGEKIARYYGPSRMKVMVRGLHKQFEDNFDAHDLRERNGLLPEQIANDILDIIL